MSSDDPNAEPGVESKDEMIGRWFGTPIQQVPLSGVPGSNGRYVVLSEIGSGGQATVYEADDLLKGIRVALKIVRFIGNKSKELARRFLLEMRSQSSLEDIDGVAKVTEYGVIDGRYGWMVMERLKGQTFKEWLKARKGRPYTLVELCFIIQVLGQVAITLAQIHARGVVHRDVKPDNIFLIFDGPHFVKIKLIDFGIAKRLTEEAAKAGEQLTADGITLGTQAYMSPEQLYALAREPNQQLDQWSLAVMAFEALTGGYFPRAETLGINAGTELQGAYISAFGMMRNPGYIEPPIRWDLVPAILSPEAVPDKERLRQEVVEALNKALHVKPEERHLSCWNLAAAFYAALGEGTPKAPPGDPNYAVGEETRVLSDPTIGAALMRASGADVQPSVSEAGANKVGNDHLTLEGTSSPKLALTAPIPSKKVIIAAMATGLGFAVLIVILFFPAKPPVRSRDAAVARPPVVVTPVVTSDAGTPLVHDANAAQHVPDVPRVAVLAPTPAPVVEADAGAPPVEPDDRHHRHGHEHAPRRPRPAQPVESDEHLARRLEAQGRAACCAGTGNPTWTSRDGRSHNCGSTMSATDRQNLCGHH